MTPPYLEVDPQREDRVLLHLYVSPRASRSRLCGEHDGRLKVQIAAPPVDGEANAEIVKYFGKLMGVSRGAVTLVSGETGKRKTLAIEGVSLAHVAGRVSAS